MNKFVISCESTVDLPYSHICERNIPVIFYTYNVDGTDYEDDMGKNPDSLGNFYKMLGAGAKPTTSQINTDAYTRFLEPLIKQSDVLHIAFGSGMSASVYNAQAAAEQLNKKYKNRIVVIDSTCSCGGYGLLVDSAADLRDQGKSMDEIIADYMESYENYYWVEKGSEQYNTISEIITDFFTTMNGRPFPWSMVRTVAEQYTLNTIGLSIDELAALEAILQGK